MKKITLLFVLSLIGCSQKEEPVKVIVQEIPAPVQAAPTHYPTLQEQAAGASNWHAAVDICKPLFADHSEDREDNSDIVGARCFMSWAKTKLTWKDVSVRSD